MRRYLPLAALPLPLLLLALPLPARAADPAAWRSHWEREALSLAPWAPDIAYDTGSGVVEFTSAEGRRLRASIVFPSGGTTGAVLHLGESAGRGPQVFQPVRDNDGMVHLYLPAESEKPGRALLDAYQALTVLLSAPGVFAGKVALLGRGEGAALAVALAGLRPGEVGCVVALDPQPPAGASGRGNLARFAALVRCPTLLLITRSGGAGDTVALLAQTLAGPVQVAVVTTRPEATWQPWIPQAFARQARPVSVEEGETGYEPGLPVDLSEP